MSRLLLALYVLIAVAASTARAQWEGGDPREEEYFAARMGGRRDVYQQEPRRLSPLPLVGGALAGFFVDKLWTKQKTKKIKKEYAQKAEAIRKEYEKVLKQQIEKREGYVTRLVQALEVAELRVQELQESARDAKVDLRQHGLDPVQLQEAADRKEFNLPDANRDGIITRYEFDTYINDYLRQNPGVTRADLPRFEDFDATRDGTVDFREWQRYLENERQAELRAAEAAKRVGGATTTNRARRV